VSAASALLDRGWGKAAQPHAGGDGEGKIEIIIRDIAEERRQACRTMLDAPPVSRFGGGGVGGVGHGHPHHHRQIVDGRDKD
jgi:hypothetical protein